MNFQVWVGASTQLLFLCVVNGAECSDTYSLCTEIENDCFLLSREIAYSNCCMAILGTFEGTHDHLLLLFGGRG